MPVDGSSQPTRNAPGRCSVFGQARMSNRATVPVGEGVLTSSSAGRHRSSRHRQAAELVEVGPGSGSVVAPDRWCRLRRSVRHRSGHPGHGYLDVGNLAFERRSEVSVDHGNLAILVRTDAAAPPTPSPPAYALGMRFSLGASVRHVNLSTVLVLLLNTAWTPACNVDGQPRDGAWVAEITRDGRLVGLAARHPADPAHGTPHPGAQLRITDTDTDTMDYGSPDSSQAPQSGSCPTWSYGTAGTPASKTASAPPNTPACATSRSTTPHRTRSGSKSASSPPTSSPFTQRLTCTGWAAHTEPKRPAAALLQRRRAADAHCPPPHELRA